MGKSVIEKLVKFIRLLSVLIVLSCCWISVSALPDCGGSSMAFAQCKNSSGKGDIKSSGTAPIHIKSDRMEAVDKAGTVYFSGHVEAVRGDLVIHSDKLKVLYKKVRIQTSSKGGAKEESEKKVIEKIIASGHVRITQRNRIATGNKAVYDKSAERITLIGNAQVWQGANRISGEKVIFFINEDRSIVESGKGKRVEAVVYPAE